LIGNRLARVFIGHSSIPRTAVSESPIDLRESKGKVSRQDAKSAKNNEIKVFFVLCAWHPFGFTQDKLGEIIRTSIITRSLRLVLTPGAS
jgi:hypothetical protein